MKLFLIGSLLLSGGTTVAMQNETLSEEVSTGYEAVKERVFKNRRNRKLANEVKEHGFPYPSEEYLATLTEDQALQLVTEIDLINATYDWPNMELEEIKEVVPVVKAQLEELYSTLEVEAPTFNEYKEGFKEERLAEKVAEVKESGLSYPSEEKLDNLTEDQALAITTKIDEYNALYDWENMTDEEIEEALLTIKSEMELLRDELGIEGPSKERKAFREGFRKGARKGYREGFKKGQETTENPVEETTEEDPTV